VSNALGTIKTEIAKLPNLPAWNDGAAITDNLTEFQTSQSQLVASHSQLIARFDQYDARFTRILQQMTAIN
jgi:hypothetical protein